MGAAATVLGSVAHSTSTTIAHDETNKFFYKLAAVIAALFAAHHALMVLVGSLVESDCPTRCTLTDLAVWKALV